MSDALAGLEGPASVLKRVSAAFMIRPPFRTAALLVAFVLVGCTPPDTAPTPASRLTVLPRPTGSITVSPLISTTSTATAPSQPAATPSVQASRVSGTQAPGDPTPEAEDARLIIPEIELDAEIIDVPIVDNNWNVDDLGERIGWLAGTGDAPGDDYAPVLAAHVSTNTGVAGPFGYLWSLSLGGTIDLDIGNRRYTYEVVDRRMAKPGDVNKVLIPDGNRLVLLTCDGWDLTRLTYDERLLVIAELRGTSSRP